MKFAVVGAGVAGLCSIHYLSEAFPEATIEAFEASEDIGGTWVYTEDTGKDEYNISIMTSMYENLRANLPKVLMEFSDFPLPEDCEEFMKQPNFLEYLNKYAKHFNLNKYIKFRHNITNIRKVPDGWRVEYDDLRANKTLEGHYDIVYVCTGHFHESFTPEMKGNHIFKGRQLHSHNYRRPERFVGRRVLIIGIGPSGLDLSKNIAEFADKVFISHHCPKFIQYLEYAAHKPDVQELKEHEVVFQDGSVEKIDDVIYCTGYNYCYPFLDSSCGVEVNRTHVNYLHRQIVNIEHPSMFFIGMPSHCCTIVLRDMQVRYTISLLKRETKLPSKEKMLDILWKKKEQREKDGLKENFVHDLMFTESDYYQEILEESGVKRVPISYCKIRQHIIHSDLNNYRNYKYVILDEYNFKAVPIHEKKNKTSELLDSPFVISQNYSFPKRLS